VYDRVAFLVWGDTLPLSLTRPETAFAQTPNRCRMASSMPMCADGHCPAYGRFVFVITEECSAHLSQQAAT
jgi:hypothetical protein